MSWEQLRSIYLEAEAYARNEQTQPPSACPYDGEPLDAVGRGILHCPWGDYEYPRDGRII